MVDIEKILKDFVEELYFRAPCAQSKEERKAIKGVQHALERALNKHGIKTNGFRYDAFGEEHVENLKIGDVTKTGRIVGE